MIELPVSLTRMMLSLSLALTTILKAQEVPVAPAQPPVQEGIAPAAKTLPATAVERIPQVVVDFYNNNPSYPLTISDTLKPIWSQNLVKLGFKVFAPTFSRDRIFLADGPRVVALDPAEGKITWEKRFDRDVDRCLAEGDLFLHSESRMGLMGGKSWLKAESLTTGKLLWTIDETWQGADLQAYDQHIYRYTFNGVSAYWLRSYDMNGKKEWEYKTRGRANLFFFDDLVVLAPSGLKKLVALRRSDGKEAWSLSLKHDSTDDAFHDGVFYMSWRTFTWNPIGAPVGDLTVMALDLRTGKPLWTWVRPADDGWFAENIGGVVTDGRYCVLNTTRHLYCLDVKTGEQKWSLNPEDKQKFLKAKPILLNGKVFVIQTVKDKSSIFQFLDLATGQETGRVHIEDEVIPPAQVVGKTLFMCFRHGDMIALPLEEPGL